MKKLLILLALTTALSAQVVPPPAAVAPKPTIESLTKERDDTAKERDALKAELAALRQKSAQVQQVTDARLTVLESQRNEFANQIVVIKADLLVTQTALEEARRPKP